MPHPSTDGDDAPAGRRPAGASREVGYAATAALAGEYAEEMVLGTTRGVHEAVARRAFDLADRATGGAARTPRQVHDAISGAVYSGVGAGIKTATAGLHVLERTRVGPRLQGTFLGRAALAAINGLVGDRLAADGSDLAIPMAVRSDDADLVLEPDPVAEAFPEAGPDVVVFMHGLAESEGAWELYSTLRGGTYGDRLAEETPWTPVYVRANTGQPLADNAVALACLLDDLVAAWPTEVRRIALVGHSMGGLIVRGACAVVTEAQERDEHRWTDRVTDVVTLGTPHRGAPLERLVHAGARTLHSFPVAAPFGRLLEYRSTGILDLRGGNASDVQTLPHARYRLVAATLGPSESSLVSHVLGDLLVRYPSAAGLSRHGPEMFPGADVLHVPSTHHFGLLNHPDVYDALRRWLDEDR